ncbi:glutathione S-transferase N-terminal domain-containing protein [Flavimobilis sp. GY10621]|uniref:Glutathione S-transferase N-terminal domain-containing protein n=1 Tax=Flavimobilis rhizosphaerae TaxID=2775421 RepID=A0ABR9DW22_9MICO|nr:MULTISPECIES: glutaredoxin domain-containing protein [Micrococcales]MBD9700195.1 glutathione S-transferase N-terminal domain-containing protein [Flavimobilis rhizosphaerae]
MAGTITMYGADWCGDCTRAKALLDREGVAYTYVDVEADEAARERAIEIAGRQNIPVIVFDDGSHLVEPSNPELLAKVRG